MTSWTDRDFDRLSWHDNHVHGLSVSEGQYGSGELALDLDFILEWKSCGPDGVQFSIAPATVWTIVINWPRGKISFEATGFSQVLRAAPILKDQQSLTKSERRDGA